MVSDFFLCLCCIFSKLCEFIPLGDKVWLNTGPSVGIACKKCRCDGNTAKPEAETRETESPGQDRKRGRERKLVAPGGHGPICHCARTIRPVTDPWTQSLQVNCDRLLGVSLCVVCVGGCAWAHRCICILSPAMPVAVSLHPLTQNTGMCVRVWESVWSLAC